MEINNPSLEKLVVLPVGESGTSSEGAAKLIESKDFRDLLVEARVTTSYQESLSEQITRTALVYAFAIGEDDEFAREYTGGGMWDLCSDVPEPVIYVVHGAYRSDDGNLYATIKLSEVKSFELL